MINNFVFVIIFSLYTNFAFTQAWYTHSLKWPDFNKDGNSIVKVQSDSLSPIINIIEKSSYRHLLSQTQEKIDNIGLENFSDIIFACKFESNSKNQGSITHGKNIDHSESQTIINSITYHQQLDLLNLDSSLERKRYFIKDVLNHSRANFKDYDFKIEKGLFLTSYLTDRHKNTICIKPELTIFDAASTLVHELIHYLYLNHNDYSLESLKDFQAFSKKYLYQRGGEVDAFHHACLFELQNRLTEDLSPTCQKSWIQDTDDFDRGLIYQSIKKRYLDQAKKAYKSKVRYKTNFLKTKLSTINSSIENFKKYLSDTQTNNHPEVLKQRKYYKKIISVLEENRNETKLKIQKVSQFQEY